jgi:hypothetical protein
MIFMYQKAEMHAYINEANQEEIAGGCSQLQCQPVSEGSDATVVCAGMKQMCQMVFEIVEETTESYVTIHGQPASLSWSKALIWGLRPDLYYMCDNYALVRRPL